MKQIDECHEILKDPNRYVQRFKVQSGRKVVGTFCSYAPEEIIVAAGAHPVRLFGTGEKIRLAEAHLQSYCCSLVRGALEDALGGRLAFLDGVVFPHTCDSIQRLSDIWRLNVSGCFHLDLVLPVKLKTPSARQYLVDVLKRFREELGAKLGVAMTDDDLRAAIALYNRIRGAMTRIYKLTGDRPGILKGSRNRGAGWSANGSSSPAASATTPTSIRSSRRREGRWSGTISAPVPGIFPA
jgi:benzoyl-CoA reductase subunit C